MKFLVDAQLPPVLARWLREAGHEASHVDGLGLRESDDDVLWSHALETNAIIVTKDEDFAARWNRARESSPLIVWLRWETLLISFSSLGLNRACRTFFAHSSRAVG